MIQDPDPTETREWAESLDGVLESRGRDRAEFLVGRLIDHAARAGLELPAPMNTPYVNSIPVELQPEYPGDRKVERRIKSLIRWNAMAMVVRANRRSDGIGGHISTFASAATLLEVGFNWFFRGRNDKQIGDQVFFQGHASPGIYARAFLEGRLSDQQLQNFRRELQPGGGLSSYPHPWLMPDFWQFPSVSMGLSPLCSIYQARFNRYLHHRGIADTDGSRIWAFLGDGEMDEPEALGAITLASRERLDNLVWVINCNLQRLDGPVRGNGKIIQELEAAFRGAGWNVIKVLWGSDWDPLLRADASGLLVKRMAETVDGKYQKYVVAPGSFTREEFFGPEPELRQLVAPMTDEQIKKLGRGGHDPAKVYAAYHAATAEPDGRPTVILAKTVKGYGLGEAGEGRNTTHQQKKLNEEELRRFRDRFEIPLTDAQIAETPLYRPPQDSEEIRYLLERRAALGGPLPRRVVVPKPLDVPPLDFFKDFLGGSGGQAASTTMAYVRMLAQLLKHPGIGKRLVPIVPDEARTFGMEALFRQCAIYASRGQLYQPVDSHLLLYYKESKEGQILEEGINEAGSFASFLAAGTSYATHGEPMIPMFIYYSMFGFQRIGDLIWQAADQRARGFLLGATSGRTTLNGEGLQHEDGHSHLLAMPVPNLLAYDATYAYEIAAIVQDGIRRMAADGEDLLYYLTLCNEPYEMPAMPEGAQEGILKGIYRLRRAETKSRKRVHLLGAGTILREVLRAADLLAERFGVAADVWSVTSWKELRRDALECERSNLLHPDRPMRVPYLTRQLEGEPWPVVAASDYVKALPHLIAPWIPQGLHALGTDGFGRSDDRKSLRRFFEVDAEHVAIAALWQLAKEGEFEPGAVAKAIRELGIDPDGADPTRR